MRHHGNVTTLTDAKTRCKVIVKDTGNSCVYIKGKCTDYDKPRKPVVPCYFVWENRDDSTGRIMTEKGWRDWQGKMGLDAWSKPVRRKSRTSRRRSKTPVLDIRNANQLQEYIMKAGFKMNPYARSYFNAIREAQDTSFMYGGASPIHALKVQAIYFLTNVRAKKGAQQDAKKALLKWAKS